MCLSHNLRTFECLSIYNKLPNYTDLLNTRFVQQVEEVRLNLPNE